MQLASFHTLLPAEAGAPEWVHLLPAGAFKGTDGRGPYRVRDAQAVIAASLASHNKLPIDENHATTRALAAGGASPARAWISVLEARPDGVWGKPEWTPSGTALMTERAYRGISPVFEYDAADGTVLRLQSAALTNAPNLPLTALHTSQEPSMDLAALRTALGLADTADEAAILAAITANKQAIASHTAQVSAIATAAGLAATAEHTAIVAGVSALRSGTGNVAEMAAKVQGLETELATLKAAGARDKAVAFVTGAIAAGKPIVALREHYIAEHVKDPARVEKEINAMVSINAGGVAVAAHDAADGDAPTAAEKEVAAKMGVDPAKLVAQRKQREKQGSAA